MIQREVLNEIKKWIGEEKILILKGTRQVGKTTLMRQIQDDLEKNGKKTYFFNIDEEIGNPIFQDVKYFIKYLQDQIVFENGKKVYIFIDEFQYLKEAGLFLKILFDKFKKEIQFIVSGSSSLEITKNSEFLTGRKIEFFIKHLSFFEYINYKSQNKYTYLSGENKEDLRIFCDIYKNDIMLHFLDYINYSGYPEICLHDNISQKKQILKELINTYIKKDIIHFLRIENINAFNNLIYLLSSQIGNLVNKNELANTLNINYETIIRYLDILKGTYLFHYIPPYYSNIRKEI